MYRLSRQWWFPYSRFLSTDALRRRKIGILRPSICCIFICMDPIKTKLWSALIIDAYIGRKAQFWEPYCNCQNTEGKSWIVLGLFCLALQLQHDHCLFMSDSHCVQPQSLFLCIWANCKLRMGTAVAYHLLGNRAWCPAVRKRRQKPSLRKRRLRKG